MWLLRSVRGDPDGPPRDDPTLRKKLRSVAMLRKIKALRYHRTSEETKSAQGSLTIGLRVLFAVTINDRAGRVDRPCDPADSQTRKLFGLRLS
jgi:hypothetical protein